MVMMEAMCAGCAVLTTGSGGAIELAEHARLPLFPKDHPFALSRLLAALEKDRARVADTGLRGQDTVLREFTLDRMLERTSHALGRLVDETRTLERRGQPDTSRKSESLAQIGSHENSAYHSQLLSSHGRLGYPHQGNLRKAGASGT